MKRTSKLLLLLVVFLSNMSFAQNEKCKSFKVYVDDDKDEFTNIRQTPNGTVIFKINKDYNAGIILNVIDFKEGWLKINKLEGVDELTMSNFVGWIHNSVVGVGATHNIYLSNKPKGKKILKIEGEQGDIFRIIDMQCEWVKIKTKKGNGWVESSELCGNPVTTCP